MAGVRALSIGAGVLSGAVLAGVLGFGVFFDCSTACDKGGAASEGVMAQTEAPAAEALADVKDEGCDKPCPMKAKNTEMANVIAQPGASVGDTVACPVNGELFTVAADSHSIDVNGEAVYVCCETCTNSDDGAAFVD